MAGHNGDLSHLTEDFSIRGIGFTRRQAYMLMKRLPDVSPQKREVYIDDDLCSQLAQGPVDPYSDFMDKGWEMNPAPFLILKPGIAQPGVPFD